MKHFIFGIFILSLFLGACLTSQDSAIGEEQTQPPTLTEAIVTDAPSPTTSPAPKIPADPQRIEFQAGDGIQLVGYYYPAAVESAPVVVLMHWASGTHCDWLGVNLVQWLQNRGLPEGLEANPACNGINSIINAPISNYPLLRKDDSFAVFTFDYRGFGESGGVVGAWDRAGWLSDTVAAVQTARKLEGVDPERVVTLGASIGADGAAIGCGEGCLGALSLSPGNYLGISYAETVKHLDAQNKPVWCAAATGDLEAFPVCDVISGTNYQKFIYGGNAHGMNFFLQGRDPKIERVIFEFIRSVFRE